MKWSDYDKYLTHVHLAGTTQIVTIARIVEEEFFEKGKGKAMKPVAYFVGKSKGLILTPTNRKILAELFGDDAQESIGKRIKIKAVETEVAHKIEHPIRIIGAVEPEPESHKPATPATPTTEKKENSHEQQ